MVEDEEENFVLSTELLQILSAEQAWHYRIVPKSIQSGSYDFYCDENADTNSFIDELELLFDERVNFVAIDQAVLLQLLSKYYRQTKQKKSAGSVKHAAASESFVDELINEACEIGCSDIHLEVYEDACRVRMRIDGKLIERYIISRDDYPALINKIKIKANLDIAEKRLPQDGRILLQSKTDIRVSVLPTLYGEKIVLRILSKDTAEIELEKLGFSAEQLSVYYECIKKTHGIVLVSGPTGSGKTTSLYGTLKVLNRVDSNILTIEDPIEYTLTGVNQVQLNEAIGLDFSAALRTFLRQDPDVIMLGEIRDSETAHMAIRAALTGHLVLSSIHTNSAWGTVSRLIDMGVPPFLISNALILSIAQRLLRVLCPRCKTVSQKQFKLPHNYRAPFEVDAYYEAVGCEECFHTGYKGRIAVFEIIPFDSELSALIKQNVFDANDTLERKGVVSLADSAFSYFAKGVTSFEEVYPILMNNL